jgi:hypothetical protein
MRRKAVRKIVAVGIRKNRVQNLTIFIAEITTGSPQFPCPHTKPEPSRQPVHTAGPPGIDSVTLSYR